MPPDTDARTVAPLQESVAAAAAPRPVVRRRARLASAVTAAGLAAFSLLAGLVSTGAAAQPDLALSVGVQQARHPLLVGLMTLVSAFGFWPLDVLTVASVVALFWLAGYRLESLFALVAAAGIAALGGVLKLFWLRPRPEEGLVQVLGSATGYSFPSGHTLFYTSFFGFLFYWCYVFLEKGRWRTASLVLLGTLVVLVGPSRVYLGHHWTSDVLAAYSLGLAYLLILLRLYRETRLRTAKT